MAKEGQPCTGCRKNEEDGAEFGSRWRSDVSPAKRERLPRCKDCRRDYYEANKERIVTQQGRYREANKERKSAVDKTYREQNRDKIASRLKTHYENNKEQYIARARKRDQIIREGVRCDFTALDWAHALSYFDYRCVYCDEKRKLTSDHAVPISKGGQHTAANIVPACQRCNDSKGSGWVEDFASPEVLERIRTFFASLGGDQYDQESA